MKHLPTLLLTLLSTAAIAGSYDDVIVRPACYVNGEAQYFAEDCPQQKFEPAYYPVRGAAVLSRTVEPYSPPPTQPTASFNTYDAPARQPAGGLYLIGEYGNGNFAITTPDGGLGAVCSSTSCFTP